MQISLFLKILSNYNLIKYLLNICFVIFFQFHLGNISKLVQSIPIFLEVLFFDFDDQYLIKIQNLSLVVIISNHFIFRLYT